MKAKKNNTLPKDAAMRGRTLQEAEMSAHGKKRSPYGKYLIILFICSVLLADGIFLYKKRYGDPTAPMNLIPAEWHAWLTFSGNEPRIRLEITAEVLRISPDKPIFIPLFPSGTVFRDVSLSGESIVPVKRDNWYCAEVRSAGRYMISAVVDAKPEKNDAVTGLSLVKPAFVRSAVHVDSADAIDFRVKGIDGRVSGTKQSGTHGVLDIGSARELEMSWREPRPEVVKTAIPSVRPSTVWKIGEKVLSANASLDVQMTGGKCDCIFIDLPQGADKVRVEGAYKHDSRLTGSRLAVYFRQQPGGSLNIRLSFDVPRPAGDTVTLPQISVDGGRMEEGGWLVVVNDTDGIVLENATAGLNAVSDLEIPAQIKGLISGRPLFLYNIIARGAAPAFDVVTKRPFPLVETIADRADIITAVQPGGEEITRIVYQIRNNSRQFIKLKMPADSSLISVTVDGRDCKVSSAAGDALVPLAKSIQTLGGLIPFPMEIIYCRQGKPLAGISGRVVDYPEISDVPVAVVNAAVYLPDESVVRSYRSSLERVDGFHSSGMSWMMQMPGSGGSNTTADVSGWINDALALNYYNVGYSAYQQNKLEQAETYLGRTKQIATDNKPLTSQSESIIFNIKAGRGDVDAKAGREQRAKVQAIQGALSVQNAELEVHQAQLVDVGLANIREGDERLGMELLKQAEDVGVQIGNRSGSRLRQQAVKKNYESELNEVSAAKLRNDELKESLERLEKEAQQAAKAAEKNREYGKKLAYGFYEGAKDQQIDVSEIQSIPGTAGADGYSQSGDISLKAEAAQMKGSLNNAGASVTKGKLTRARGSSGSIKEENAKLGAKVTALKKALDYAKSDATASGPAAGQQVDISSIRQSVAKQEERASQLAANYTLNDAWTDDGKVDRELEQISNWTLSGRNSFGNLDDELARDYDKVNDKVRAAKEKINWIRGERKNASQVAMDVSGVVNRDNQEKQKALERFIATNYIAGVQMDAANGQLIVANDSGKAGEVGTVLRKLQDNRGNAVTVGGRNVGLDYKEMPVINGWFTNQTTDGKKYAVIDEAQYRTLIQVAAGLKQGAAPVSVPEKRDVVVGTESGVAGERMSLVRADADRNGVRIGGTEIELEHDKYLAVGDDDGISVIKAGEMHNWQEQGKDLALDVDIPFRFDVPQTGTKICFEKTLLSAGESADIHMEFEI